MPGRKQSLKRLKPCILIIASLLITVLPAFNFLLPAAADDFPSRSLQLLNDAPGSTTTYNLSFTISTNTTIGSLDILFCSNTPLPGDSCTLPAGLNVANAVLSSQSGLTGFTLYPAATNELVLSRAASLVTPPLPVAFSFTNVVNPSSPGPYYARISAYSSTNATGSMVDFGGLAYAINNNLLINSVVPPYLTFCAAVVIPSYDCSAATGDYIDLGDLSTGHSSQADSQLLVATNAAGGYVIQVSGTTMTSGNNTIAPIGNDSASKPGTSQFGINLRANTLPTIGADPTGPGYGQPTTSYNNPNQYQFVDADTIANSLNADNYREYTVSYLVNISSNQAPGVYVSTLTYICAGSF